MAGQVGYRRTDQSLEHRLSTPAWEPAVVVLPWAKRRWKWGLLANALDPTEARGTASLEWGFSKADVVSTLSNIL